MRPRRTLALANLLSAGHFYLVAYILGPYLSAFMPAWATGSVIAAGALLTLAAFPYVPEALRHLGIRRFVAGVAIAQAVTLLVLATNPSALAAAAAVAVACALAPFIGYALDLYLEAATESEAITGSVRTAFLTAGNLPLIVAPILIAMLLDSGSAYERVFLAAGLSLVPFIFLMLAARLPKVSIPEYRRIRDTFSCIRGDRDLRATFFANYLLQVFYHLAPLYLSLYLFDVIGLPWDTLGWMYAIMLLPFVLIEYPAGQEGDRRGDRHLMGIGFLTMGFSFALVALLTPATPLLAILIVIVATRVGAALVEAMTEGHFFRAVSDRDPTTVEAFRMMRPIAALTAPLMGSAVLYFGGYEAVFGGLGLLLAILGFSNALRVRGRYPGEALSFPAEAR